MVSSKIYCEYHKPTFSITIYTMFTNRSAVKSDMFQVIHGSRNAVNFICDNPDIKAISFVGSDQGGKHVYQRGCANGKRVQSNLAAKNHAVVLPDANKEATIDQLCGAAFGAAGQRCMAISVAVLVGEARNWIPDIVARAKRLKVNAGIEPGTDVGPVISPQAKQRILRLVESGIKQVTCTPGVKDFTLNSKCL